MAGEALATNLLWTEYSKHEGMEEDEAGLGVGPNWTMDGSMQCGKLCRLPHTVLVRQAGG